MRAFNAQATRTTVKATATKSWQWNAGAAQAEQHRAKELQAAQRRFRKSATAFV